MLALRRREQVRRDSLDGVALGAIVVRRDSRVVRMNIAADLVSRRSDGFQVRDGLLSCLDPGSRMRLQAALALATAPDNRMATAISVERLCPRPEAASLSKARPLAYVVSVTPMPTQDGAPLAMLVFRDPEGPDNSLTARLRPLFRPSRAEPRDSSASKRRKSSGERREDGDHGFPSQRGQQRAKLGLVPPPSLHARSRRGPGFAEAQTVHAPGESADLPRHQQRLTPCGSAMISSYRTSTSAPASLSRQCSIIAA